MALVNARHLLLWCVFVALFFWTQCLFGASHLAAVVVLDRRAVDLLEPITGAIQYTNVSDEAIWMRRWDVVKCVNPATGKAAPRFVGLGFREGLALHVPRASRPTEIKPGETLLVPFRLATNFVERAEPSYTRLMPGEWVIHATMPPSRSDLRIDGTTPATVTVSPGSIDLAMYIRRIDGRLNVWWYPDMLAMWDAELLSAELRSVNLLLPGETEWYVRSATQVAAYLDDHWRIRRSRISGPDAPCQVQLIDAAIGDVLFETPCDTVVQAGEGAILDWTLSDSLDGRMRVNLLVSDGSIVQSMVEPEAHVAIARLCAIDTREKHQSATLAADGSRAYVVQNGQVMAYGIDGSQRVITRGDLQDRIHHHLRGCAGTTSEPRAAFYYEPETAELRTLPGPWAPVAIDEDAGVIAFEHAETHEVTVRSLETFDEIFNVALERAGEQYVLLPRPTRLVVAFASETTPGFLDEVVLVCDGATVERLDLSQEPR